MTADDAGREIRQRPDYDHRMAAARRRAAYELGDPTWAGVILGAFLYPDADTAALAQEQAGTP